MQIADPSDLSNAFQSLDDLKGTIGLIASGIFLLIRLYRLPDWQPSLPYGIRWENLPTLAKYGIIASLALSGSLLASTANGLSWQEALAAGVTAILAAITTDKLTKAAPVRAVAHVIVPTAEKVAAGA